MVLIEQVARAIWDAQYESGTSWDDWADYVAKNPGGFDGRDTSRNLARAALTTMQDREATLVRENADLKSSVIAFAGPWAGEWARLHGLPKGHLHAQHYDLLEQCGARMSDFTREALGTSGLVERTADDSRRPSAANSPA